MSQPRSRISILALIACATVTTGLMTHGAVAPTSAAWSDQSYTSATVTAGTWRVLADDTCIAYGWDGGELDGCEVVGISHDAGWGAPGQRTRNFQLSFAVPGGTKRVSFDVDLDGAEGPGDADWSWQNAGILTGVQLSPVEGWTCDDLPRLTANGNDWQTQTIYLQATENRGGSSTVCS